VATSYAIVGGKLCPANNDQRCRQTATATTVPARRVASIAVSIILMPGREHRSAAPISCHIPPAPIATCPLMPQSRIFCFNGTACAICFLDLLPYRYAPFRSCVRFKESHEVFYPMLLFNRRLLQTHSLTIDEIETTMLTYPRICSVFPQQPDFGPFLVRSFYLLFCAFLFVLVLPFHPFIPQRLDTACS